jgi:hypothetical protein
VELANFLTSGGDLCGRIDMSPIVGGQGLVGIVTLIPYLVIRFQDSRSSSSGWSTDRGIDTWTNRESYICGGADGEDGEPLPKRKERCAASGPSGGDRMEGMGLLWGFPRKRGS